LIVIPDLTGTSLYALAIFLYSAAVKYEQRLNSEIALNGASQRSPNACSSVRYHKNLRKNIIKKSEPNAEVDISKKYFAH
jgi:hypothetical protein